LEEVYFPPFSQIFEAPATLSEPDPTKGKTENDDPFHDISGRSTSQKMMEIKFFVRMRGALTPPPIIEDPVMRMPLDSC